MDLHEKAALLPLAPGVYLYKDAAAKVIYVGKAKSLRARVRSYFNEDRLADAKTGSLIAEARDIDYILVDNEKEALALENNLIKQYKPRFNVLLRDDKTYPVYQADQRTIPARLRHPPADQGRLDLLRPVFSRQSRAPAGALHSPAFSGAVLQGRSDALPSQAVSAVPHSPLPGAVRGGPDDATKRTRRRSARCACFSKAGTRDLAQRTARPHGGALRTTCASKKPPPCAIC